MPPSATSARSERRTSIRLPPPQATEKQRLTTVLVEVLWDLLLDLDDLSPSTASVMKLLSQLYTVLGVQGVGATSTGLQELVPRLWPFLRHTIASVRLSAACTLEQLVQVSTGACVRRNGGTEDDF